MVNVTLHTVVTLRARPADIMHNTTTEVRLESPIVESLEFDRSVGTTLTMVIKAGSN